MEHWEIINLGGTVVSNTPEELWGNACKYFQWCDNTPITSRDTLMSGKDGGKQVNVEKKRPYTIKGLCMHCGILEEYLKDVRDSRNSNNMFYIVVSKILYIIYTQNVENAMVNNFNPIFTAKVLNMENEEPAMAPIKIEIVPGIPTLSRSENEILEKLESEIQMSENTKEQ